MIWTKELALAKHAEWKGKLSIETKAPITNKEELAIAYTPGVAEPCLAIEKGREPGLHLYGKRQYGCCHYRRYCGAGAG